VLRVIGVLEDSFGEFEIIIAEDGSTDDTYRVCVELERKFPFVRVSHSEGKLGKGRALKKAFGLIEGGVLVLIDADLPFNLDSLTGLISPLKDGYSLVIGSRYLEDSVVKRSVYRTFKSRVYNFLVNFFFKDGVRDHQCGYKAMNLADLMPILSSIDEDNFFFDTELIVKTKRAGFSILEIPIEWVEPEGRVSKVSFWDEMGVLYAFFRFLMRGVDG